MNISFTNLFTKNDLVNTYYINLVETIIRHQKLRLTWESFKKYVRSKLPGFDPRTPLLVPVRFTCTTLPLYVRFSEIPPHPHLSQIKFRDAYDAYFE